MSKPLVPTLDLTREHREIETEIRAAIERVIGSGMFIGGEEVRSFEREFADYCGARHCVGVANGTDALVLALRALDVGPGDKVLTAAFTFFSTAGAIDLVGAEPVFVDVDESDYTLDVAATEDALQRQAIKAVIAVHLFGQPARMEAIVAAARRHGAAVIEDAAQAHGARLQCGSELRRTGTLGDLGCFSFYPTKNLGALGDAGAVTADRDDLAERVRLLHDHGQAEKYRHVLRGGTTSRLDAIQAAILRLKLRRLDTWNEARRALAERYGEQLSGLPLLLPQPRRGSEHVYHQYVVRVTDRAGVQAKILSAGVQSAIHYPVPVHLQEAYRELGYVSGSFPIAERCAAEVLSLPLFPRLRHDEQDRVIEALRQVL